MNCSSQACCLLHEATESFITTLPAHPRSHSFVCLMYPVFITWHQGFEETSPPAGKGHCSVVNAMKEVCWRNGVCEGYPQLRLGGGIRRACWRREDQSILAEPNMSTSVLQNEGMRKAWPCGLNRSTVLDRSHS